MDNEVLISLQKRVREVNDLLSNNPSWRDKFNEHINKISYHATFFDKLPKKSYRVKASTHLFVYSSISSIKKSTSKCRYYDLRYAGQSVANIKLQKEGNSINTYISTKNKENKNKIFLK